MKFGGTSVQDADAIRRVAGIIEAAREQRPVVVVSAVAGATRDLLAIGETALHEGPAAAKVLLDKLDARHREIIEELGLAGSVRSQVEQRLARTLDELTACIDGIALLRQYTAQTQDQLLVHGELLSSQLVFAATRQAGLPTRWVDAMEIMRTDDHFRAARPDRAALPGLVEPALRRPVSEEEIPITQGFIGATADGHPTTLGFEASDYSASLFAEALSGREVQIWTDVPGMLTTGHPGVAGVHCIRRLSFDEAAAMSFFGAKVLHPRTVEPLVAGSIPLRIRDSRAPQGDGTLIVPEGDGVRGIVKCLAVKAELSSASLRTLPGVPAGRALRRLAATLDRLDATPDLLTGSGDRWTVACGDEAAMNAMISACSAVLQPEEQARATLVSLIGLDVGSSRETLCRAVEAAQEAGLGRVVPGVSRHALSLLVEPARVDDLAQALHGAFFGSGLDPQVFVPLEAMEVAS